MKLPPLVPPSVKALAKKLLRSRVLNFVYLFLMVMLLASIAGLVISSVSFLVTSFNEVLFVSDSDIASQVASFDVVALAKIAPKLGITLPAAASPLPESLPVSEELPAPPPEPEAVFDPASLRIQVLNGTNTGGLAKTWKERFEAGGFVVAAVGNAENAEYAGVHIRFRAAAAPGLPRVRALIASHGASLVEEKSEELPEHDMVVIIGR